ncbi:transcription antitermination factor NusB [Calditrichota bacterium]
MTLLTSSESDVNRVQSDDAEQGPRVHTRRQAREIALKAAYAIEMRNDSKEVILSDPLINGEKSPPSFTIRLLSSVEEHKDYIDDLIRSKVERWEFHRIALVDKIILRIGCAELLYFSDVPPKVSINEAIEIAKTFSTDKSGRFVNGILDAVYNDVTKGNLPITPKEELKA